MRVLVVEDEALIALEIDTILSEAGLAVAGPVSSVRDALDLIAKGNVDAAVLDVNLGRETSEPIAEELNRRTVPFIAVSGYASDQRPSSMSDAPFLAKPFRARDLIACIRQLLSQ